VLASAHHGPLRCSLARRLALVAGLVAACAPASSQPDAGFPADPLTTVTSQSGSLTLAVRTSPQPPSRGVLAVQLTVTDASGPVDGLTITVTPWMPDHGHGASVQPQVSAQGSGVYLVTDVYLAMPGQWELRLGLDGTTHDTATITLQIP